MDLTPKNEGFKHPPKSISLAIEEAWVGNPWNKTAKILSRDFSALASVTDTIRDLGQTRLIGLSRKYIQSAVVLAFYAGDGHVVKIIPKDTLGTQGVVFHLPAISSHDIKTSGPGFVIKTYPWVPPGSVSSNDIEQMGKRLARLGLGFTEGDALPKNVHRIPDKDGTLVGIDSCMYKHVGRSTVATDLSDSWHEYVHEVYPIYNQGSIPAQTDKTDFNPLSIHDRAAQKRGFDLAPGNGTLRQKTFMESFFGFEL